MSVTLQNLSDCGLNPFAIKLLVESWKGHPKPLPVSFVFDGVQITIELPGDASVIAERDRLREENAALLAENAALRHALAVMLLDHDNENDDPEEVAAHAEAARAALAGRTA